MAARPPDRPAPGAGGRLVVPAPGRGVAAAGSLTGETVVLTGIFPELGGGAGLNLGKDRAKALIESFGGKCTSAISGKTTMLLVGKEPGFSKVSQARGRGIRIMELGDLTACLQSGGGLPAPEETPQLVIDNFSAGYRGNGLVGWVQP